MVEAVKAEAQRMYQYPDDSMYELKESLAKKFDIQSQNIIIGAGSDQVIEFLARAKANEKSKILMSKTTFAMYEIYAKGVGATVVRTPSDEHRLEEFLEIYEKEENIDIIFLCLPNNPLGESLDTKEVYEFISKIDQDTLVVIDGAYQEYASFKDEKKKIDPKDLTERFPNTVYLGTFSKAYALGGMRVGYGISNIETINALYKLRPPFNITVLSLKAAIEALKNEDFVKDSIKNNFIQMKRYEEYAENNDIKYISSYTNFITWLLPENKNSKEISNSLLKKGIIIRDLSSYGMNAIRTTIGTAEQNDIFFDIFTKIYSTGR